MPPRTVGRYEVLSVIGRGGVGTVYRARHRETGERVAVKLLGPPPACDPGAARRLAREFEALHGLSHPNVIRVFEAGVQEGYSYLVMELVEGLDLRSYLSPALDDVGEPGDLSGGPSGGSDLEPWTDEPATESFSIVDDPSFCDARGTGGDERSFDGGGPEAIRAFADLMEEPETDPGMQPSSGDARAGASRPAADGPRPLSRAMLAHLNQPRRVERLRDAMVQVCGALAYVHRRGLVHRDLKPSNIMVDDLRRVRLMDFGLVKLASDEANRAGHPHQHVVGTYRYMSPEQARGDRVDHRADLYSLGVVLYELLCARPPFFAPRPSDLWEAITARPPAAASALNPGVDPALAYVAERLLAKHPRERFQSAEEVAAAIAR